MTASKPGGARWPEIVAIALVVAGAMLLLVVLGVEEYPIGIVVGAGFGLAAGGAMLMLAETGKRERSHHLGFYGDWMTSWPPPSGGRLPHECGDEVLALIEELGRQLGPVARAVGAGRDETEKAIEHYEERRIPVIAQLRTLLEPRVPWVVWAVSSASDLVGSTELPTTKEITERRTLISHALTWVNEELRHR